MEFRILGALEVARDDELIRIASPLQRRLLAALLVRAREVVSTDRLVDVLWGAQPPVDARQSLWTNVARLRRVLGEPGDRGAGAPLLTRSPGYLLDVTPEQMDSGRFETLTEAASTLAASHPDKAGELLDQALRLWRGPALQEFAEDEFAATEAARLEELRLVVTEERFETDLRLGTEHEVVGRLTAYTHRHPFRERPRAQLMLALYRCGRQAEALETYRDYQELLDRDLGVKPSQMLRDRQTEILRQAPSLDRGSVLDDGQIGDKGTPPVSQPPSSSASSLPLEFTSLVGREQDLAQTLAALADSRLVTVTGVGGVGKTRLAIRTAALTASSFTDGLSWCELAPVTDPSEVAAAVATALGVRRSAESSVVESVVDYLSLRDTLLVLDNCEHLLGGVRPLVESLLRGCPRVVVLATSRVRLAVAGECVRPVAPLLVPLPSDRPDPASPAVALFVERARAVRAGLLLDEGNLSKIADICRRLDGLPLALELAAARIRSLNPTDLLDRVRTRLDLVSPLDHRTDRHATLTGVLDWSYELLSPAQQSLFDRLSVFAGGFDVAAAEAVCGGGDVEQNDVVDLLTALVDASMVTVGSSAGPVRYTLLETLRQYGAQHLQGVDADAIRLAHAGHYATFAEHADHGLRGPGEAQWVSIVDAELDNCRVAHRTTVAAARPDLALALSRGLRYYMLFRFRDEVVSWGEGALETPGASEHPLYPEVCGAVGEGVTVRGEMSRATALAECGLGVISDPDDYRRMFGLRAAGMVSLYVGRLDDALHQHTEMLRLARLHNYPYEAGMALLGLAQSRTYAAEPGEGLEYAQEQYRVVRPLGNPSMLSLAWYDRAEALAILEPEQAIEPYQLAVNLAASAGSTFVEGIALVGLASLLGRSGEAALALPLFGSIITRWRQMGVWHHQWTTLRNLVQLFLRINRWEQAAILAAAITASGTAAPAFGADADLEQTAADRLQHELGPVGWAMARDRGAAMSADEAVEFACRAIDKALSSAGS